MTRPRIRLDTFDNRGFDRGAGPVREFLWLLTSLKFFWLPLPIPSGFRRWLLRLFGAEVGEGVVIRHGVHIKFPWKLRVGDHSWIGEGVRILNLAPVAIGNHVCLSQEAFLCTGSHDFKKESFDLITAPIAVGDHSWIAARAFLAPGVTVGEGVRIGAGATVTEDVPDGATVKAPG